LKKECDDWYGRNLDAKEREDSLKCINADKRLALVEESGEATNTNFIVFGLTRSWLETTIYRTRSEHTNDYATNAVMMNRIIRHSCNITFI
jgi:hypothetical protein